MSEQTRRAIQGFHDALNSHDIESLALLVHEDCIFETTDPPDGTRHVGRAAVLKACQEFFEQSPQARFEMEEIMAMGDRAVVLWRYA
jgi:ketosteroid isomerase-like protein